MIILDHTVLEVNLDGVAPSALSSVIFGKIKGGTVVDTLFNLGDNETLVVENQVVHVIYQGSHVK